MRDMNIRKALDCGKHQTGDDFRQVTELTSQDLSIRAYFVVRNIMLECLQALILLSF